MNTIEYRLLNDFQRDLPLCPAPYEQMGRALEIDEASVIAALKQLRQDGKVSRVGAVFRPNTVSASTLAAMLVPEQRLDEIASLVSTYPSVSHNYSRTYRWNLWFVASARDDKSLAQVLDSIEARTGCPMLRLPLVESYHIDLGFDLGPASADIIPVRRVATTRHNTSAPTLTETEAALAAQLTTGLALEPRPFAELATRASTSESTAIDTISRWVQGGVITRFGVIVRHHELGYTSNAMVGFDVPDKHASEVGLRVAEFPEVTLCAQRVRCLPEWPYNIYCMIHGRDNQRVLAQIDALRERAGLLHYPHAVLFSRQRFKQQAARIAEEVAHG
jgi:DNA-binding Lrp family transcriptional regulator